MSPIAVKGRRFRICSAVRSRFCSPPRLERWITFRTGKLRGLAITTAARADVLPELPPVGDFVPGYDASQWYGLGAPKNTPADIIDRLNREINAALADPAMKMRFADLGGEPLAGTPAEFGRLIAAETEKWAKVVRFAGLRAE